MKRPGRWLRAAASRICAPRTMERVVDPIVADLQREYGEAARAGRSWRAAWIRFSGYSAFWKAVSLHTVLSIPRGIIADGWALGRIIAFASIAFVVVTSALAAFPMIEIASSMQQWLKPTLSLLPQAMVISIPIALCLGIVCGARGIGPGARRIRGVLTLAAVATLLAFGSVLLMPVANQAFRVAVAQDLGMRGITEHSLPKGMNELSFSELASKSREYDAGGFPEKARQFRQTFHLHVALPAATFALSLLALGIFGTVRWRPVRVVVLVAAIGMYYVALRLSQSTPLIAVLPTMVAAWTPNIVVTAVAVALLKVSSGAATSEAGTS